MMAAMVEAVPALHCLRDPTRGGLASTLNEIARQSGCGMRLEEPAIPVRPEVAAACELLGLDPLYVANEGKLVLAGPFDGVDGWRGLFVLAVADVEEARRHVGTDPVVMRGEMIAEYHKYYGSAALMLVNDLHKRLVPKRP